MEIGRRLLLARVSADDNTARLDRLEFDRRFGLARGSTSSATPTRWRRDWPESRSTRATASAGVASG